MPTDRPRYMLTATDEVAAALQRAAARWPEDAERPSRLLHRLIAAGDAASRTQDAASTAARRASVAETSGAFTGLYPPGYLDGLREDWPA